MLLDFQNFTIDEHTAENKFEQQVLDFIKSWFSPDEKVLVKTSGSTGKPKTIEVEKVKMRNSAKMTCDFLNLEKGDTALLCLPVDYISGKMMVVRAIERQLRLQIEDLSLKPLKDLTQNFDFCALTPLQVENSLDKIHYLKKMIIGGAKVSVELKTKININLASQNAESEVYETFGMSETLSHIALRQISPVEELFFTAFESVEITTDERNCLKIFAPLLNSETLQTNDIVELKNKRQFRFIGRADFVINSGGLKISPEELEKLVKKVLPRELIFVGIADLFLGEKLVLVLEGEEDNSLLDKIKEINFPLKNQRPREIFFLENFPRSETGKILRPQIRNRIEKFLND